MTDWPTPEYYEEDVLHWGMDYPIGARVRRAFDDVTATVIPAQERADALGTTFPYQSGSAYFRDGNMGPYIAVRWDDEPLMTGAASPENIIRIDDDETELVMAGNRFPIGTRVYYEPVGYATVMDPALQRHARDYGGIHGGAFHSGRSSAIYIAVDWDERGQGSQDPENLTIVSGGVFDEPPRRNGGSRGRGQRRDTDGVRIT